MTLDRNIWKTGVAAIVATLIFAVFIFRAEQWLTGFDGEFVVYGQSPGTGGSAGGTGNVGTITKVLPQIVAGSYDGGLTKYVTVIQVTNTSPAAVSVSGTFYTTTGAPSTLTVTNVATSTSFVESTSLAVNSSLVLRVDATAGTTNWARIVTTGSAAVSSYFELRDVATNVLYTRVGIAASAADMTSFVIPRVRNVATGLDVGFAVVNTGTTAATITGTLRNANGVTVAARQISLPGLNHTAVFANQFFSATGCDPCLGTEASGTLFGTVTFTSSQPQFAAVALSIEGAALSGTALERLQ